jgi:hypothetical protein
MKIRVPVVARVRAMAGMVSTWRRATLTALLFLAIPCLADEPAPVEHRLGTGESAISFRVLLPRSYSVRVSGAGVVSSEMHRHLAAGRIEDAALLSNAPKRRHEVLADYQASVGESEFRRVFAQYQDGRNSAVAVVEIGPRQLIVWKLADTRHLAGEYFVAVEGRYYLDDVPSIERTRLRRVLEALRSGEIALPLDERADSPPAAPDREPSRNGIVESR